jgi:hypothetical protein
MSCCACQAGPTCTLLVLFSDGFCFGPCHGSRQVLDTAAPAWEVLDGGEWLREAAEARPHASTRAFWGKNLYALRANGHGLLQELQVLRGGSAIPEALMMSDVTDACGALDSIWHLTACVAHLSAVGMSGMKVLAACCAPAVMAVVFPIRSHGSPISYPQLRIVCAMSIAFFSDR